MAPFQLPVCLLSTQLLGEEPPYASFQGTQHPITAIPHQVIVQTYVYGCVHVCLHMYMYMYMYICMHVSLVHIFVCVHVYVLVCY